jgi:hypothetical protein
MWGYIDYYFCSLYTFNTLEEYSKWMQPCCKWSTDIDA